MPPLSRDTCTELSEILLNYQRNYSAENKKLNQLTVIGRLRASCRRKPFRQAHQDREAFIGAA